MSITRYTCFNWICMSTVQIDARSPHLPSTDATDAPLDSFREGRSSKLSQYQRIVLRELSSAYGRRCPRARRKHFVRSSRLSGCAWKSGQIPL